MLEKCSIDFSYISCDTSLNYESQNCVYNVFQTFLGIDFFQFAVRKKKWFVLKQQWKGFFRRSGSRVYHARWQRSRLRPELPSVPDEQIAQPQTYPLPLRKEYGDQLPSHPEGSGRPIAECDCWVRTERVGGEQGETDSGNKVGVKYPEKGIHCLRHTWNIRGGWHQVMPFHQILQLRLF